MDMSCRLDNKQETKRFAKDLRGGEHWRQTSVFLFQTNSDDFDGSCNRPLTDTKSQASKKAGDAAPVRFFCAAIGPGAVLYSRDSPALLFPAV